MSAIKKTTKQVLLLCVCTILACGSRAGKETPAVWDGKALVFILGGQSNMVGCGKYEELLGELKEVPENVTFYNNGKTDFATSANFGPEVSFAHEIAKAFPNNEIIIVKHGVGGTSILEWLAIESPGREVRKEERWALYAKLMQGVAAATDGRKVKFCAVLWEQGGRDAKFHETAPDYAGHLKTLIEGFRKDTRTPNLPFIYGEIATPIKIFPATEEVRACQRQVAGEVANVKLVDTKGVSTLPDDTHFDTGGQIVLGKRYAKAYLEMTR